MHLRADEPCKKSTVVPAEGIDQDTERKLRERKRYNCGQTETQRWGDIYLLLFPGADRNAIPSSCTFRFHLAGWSGGSQPASCCL